jgi:hypothetical protein
MIKKTLKISGIVAVVFVLVANLQYALFNYGVSNNSLSLPTFAQTSTNGATGSSSSDIEGTGPNFVWDEVTSQCVYSQTIPLSVTVYSNYTAGGTGSVSMVGNTPTGLSLGSSAGATNYSTVTAMAAVVFNNSSQATSCVVSVGHLCELYTCRASMSSTKSLLYNGNYYSMPNQ